MAGVVFGSDRDGEVEAVAEDELKFHVEVKEGVEGFGWGGLS